MANSSSDELKTEENSQSLPNRPKKYFGSRHVFGFMGFLALTTCYMMRSNLSVAIVVMINSTSISDGYSALSSPSSFKSSLFSGTSFHTEKLDNSTSTDNGTCADDGSSANINTRGEFDWSSEEKGLVLGAFYWGYIVTQIPGGIMAERFGGKWVVGVGVLATAILTVISPVVTRSGGYVALIIVRILTGLAEGIVFPAVTSMVSKWVPSAERSTIGAFVLAGTLFGTIISFPLSGWLCDLEIDNGWPLSFYVPGAIGLVWFVGWVFLIYDNPAVHPRIDEEEKNYILATSGKSANQSLRSTPWLKIITSIPVWAIIITHFGQNWGFSMLLTQLPTYMNAVLHFDIKANGVLSALPYLAQWIVSFVISIIADKLRINGTLSTVATRKLFTTMGLLIPACGLIAATYTGCDPIGTVILLTLTSGFNGANNSEFMVNHMDIASNYVGMTFGISQTLANSCGFIVPAVVGAIVTNEQSLKQWQTIFFISAGIYLAVNIVYLVFGSGEEQSWNKRTELTTLSQDEKSINILNESINLNK